MLVNMVRRFIFAQYPRPMAVTVFGNVLASIADIRELSSIKRHRQLAVAKSKAAAEAAAAAAAAAAEAQQEELSSSSSSASNIRFE